MTAQGQHGNSGNLLKDRRGCAPTVVNFTAVSELNLYEKKVAQRGGCACAQLLASQIWGEADWRDTYCQAG
jgi:hypothetical protein